MPLNKQEKTLIRFLWHTLDGAAFEEDGGKGSGNWGHKGRAGKRGGSGKGGGKHNREGSAEQGFKRKEYTDPFEAQRSNHATNGGAFRKGRGEQFLPNVNPKPDTSRKPDWFGDDERKKKQQDVITGVTRPGSYGAKQLLKAKGSSTEKQIDALHSMGRADAGTILITPGKSYYFDGKNWNYQGYDFEPQEVDEEITDHLNRNATMGEINKEATNKIIETTQKSTGYQGERMIPVGAVVMVDGCVYIKSGDNKYQQFGSTQHDINAETVQAALDYSATGQGHVLKNGQYMTRYGAFAVLSMGENGHQLDMGVYDPQSKTESNNAQQKATTAKAVQNMNEQQINQEIASRKDGITRLNKKIDQLIGKNDSSMRQAFPLGTGGLSQAQIQKRLGKSNTRSLAVAHTVSGLIQKRDSLQKELDNLQSTQKRISGTGKTLKQITEQAKQNAGKTSTLQWKRGKNAQGQTVYNAGDYTIKAVEGTYFIYKGNKSLGYQKSLKNAQGFVAQHNKVFGKKDQPQQNGGNTSPVPSTESQNTQSLRNALSNGNTRAGATYLDRCKPGTQISWTDAQGTHTLTREPDRYGMPGNWSGTNGQRFDNATAQDLAYTLKQNGGKFDVKEPTAQQHDHGLTISMDGYLVPKRKGW